MPSPERVFNLIGLQHAKKHLTVCEKLVESPVLAYPDFNKDFVLEMDASICGLVAVLSQSQDDGYFHPISYASRALSVQERNYGITELETLAVVWAMSHFHKYLYGHNVTIFTDHAAVNAVLQSPTPSSKHARWWTKVYGSGVRDVQIIYHPVKENRNADALSYQPHALKVKYKYVQLHQTQRRKSC